MTCIERGSNRRRRGGCIGNHNSVFARTFHSPFHSPFIVFHLVTMKVCGKFGGKLTLGFQFNSE